MSYGYVAESTVEANALECLNNLGWEINYGGDIAPNTANALRTEYTDVVLTDRLLTALYRINPRRPKEAIHETHRKLTHLQNVTLEAKNRMLHRMLVNGVTVDYVDSGQIRGAQIQVIDFDEPGANDWLAVSQFTVEEDRQVSRADIVLFVNGLPLVVFELKNPADETATIWSAFRQLQTYNADIPSLFVFNAALVISDGLEARIGTLTSGREWFKPWRTIMGETEASPQMLQLQVLTRGVCEPHRLLVLVRDFIVYEDDGSGTLVMKIAGYHQFHAVEVAIGETLRAIQIHRKVLARHAPQGRVRTSHKPSGEPGDRRIGVIWHTQGSGKSLTMAFYAGRIVREPEMENPTIVVLTDRNDLDDQLFTTFARCKDLLRQSPEQAKSRTDLRHKLSVQSGGIVFTTIQKFFPDEKGDQHPLLSDRRNIAVIADEAHRSQYDFIGGYARHMHDALANASFNGFTGTPIELADANTRVVFGDHISIYESRLAELALDEREKPNIDSDVEEVTEAEEDGRREKVKTKWAQLEAVVGAEKRLTVVASDIVDHFGSRLEAMDGKAMVVCMSRRICIDMYRELVLLRPDWHADDDGLGKLKVVMTGSASDPLEWQQHIRDKPRRRMLAKRFRDPDDPLIMVLVRDMWLTGFDAPGLHTMYVDKPTRGHGLMQAIARVNRVFRNKPAGLVVNYLGLAYDLRRAIATYTESGGRGKTVLDKAKAVQVLQEKYEICCGLFHGFDRTADSQSERLGLLPAAMEHILAQDIGKERCLKAVREFTQAFTLGVPHEETVRIRDDVSLFQAVRVALSKRAASEGMTDEELDHAMRQIVSRAVVPDGILDIFASAGLKKPDVSILSEKFLAEVRDMQRPNLGEELLQVLLKGELATRRRKNVVQARSFAELLEQAIRRYQNRALEAAQILEELIQLARKMREATARGEEMGLSEDELAFYDALGTNDIAVQVLGDEIRRNIARELVNTVRATVTIDWTLRENVRANLRRLVKLILRRHRYPPDRQEKATRAVLEQAEVLSADWANAQ